MKSTILYLNCLLAASALGGEFQNAPLFDRTADDTDSDGVFETLLPDNDTTLQINKNRPTSGHRHNVAMEFDISEVPTHSRIKSATLTVTATAVTSYPPLIIVYGYEGDGVAESADFSTGERVGSRRWGIANRVVSFDVTDFVEKLSSESAETAGFRFSDATFECSNCGVVFSSSEGSDSPVLSVEYEPAVPVIDVQVSAGGIPTVTVDTSDTSSYEYTLEKSDSLTGWSPFGAVFLGDGTRVTREAENISINDRMNFRVSVREVLD